jgi:hypothetical protein
MRAGYIVRDGSGRYWRVYSVSYVPGWGIHINMERLCMSRHMLLSSFAREGGTIARRGE